MLGSYRNSFFKSTQAAQGVFSKSMTFGGVAYSGGNGRAAAIAVAERSDRRRSHSNVKMGHHFSVT
jgi:hypothetical protein